MWEQLSDRLQKVLKFLRGEAKVTEKNMAEALRMLRLALLEADVNYRVVRDFEERIRSRALGEKVLESLTPAQQVIKIVRDELISILGSEARPLTFAPVPPSLFMLVGLQGSGKTTTCGKLALWARSLSRHPLLASLDLKRLAAQEQLKNIAEQLRLPFYEMPRGSRESLEEALRALVQYARNRSYDPLILDTAGRLHVDEELMAELRRVRDILKPTEVIYVGDAMTGQDAVKSAQVFSETVGLTSIILTKLDGDARGGAALSIVSVTGKPIAFIGVGEKFDRLEVFHPDRMASRILGMGDLLTLVEKAEKEADLKESEELARKIRREEFTLEDFRKQIIHMKKLGSLSQVVGMLPGTGPWKNLARADIDDRKLLHFEAILNSMTAEERSDEKILNGSRRLRIARGSGRPVSEVNQLLRQFAELKRMMKKTSFKKILGTVPSRKGPFVS